MTSQPSRAGFKRELIGLSALCLLIGGAFFLLVRWRESSPDYGFDARGNNQYSCGSGKIALSPGGSYLAAICSSQSTSGQSGSSNANRELVVFSMGDGKELARFPADSESAGRILWSKNEQFIGLEGRFTQIFHWKSKQLVNNPVARVIGGSSSATDLDVLDSWLDLDGDVKVQSISDGGLQAFRISTGAAIPVKWRYRRDASHAAGDWTMALQPSRPGGPLLAVIAQEEELPYPRPTPTPVPTPTPTPIPSPEQRAFLEKESAMNEEVGQIVEKLQGEEPPSEEEAAQLEARAHKINAHLREERKRLFPAEAAELARRSAPPERFGHVMLVDLKSGRVFWKKRITRGVFLPELKISPDGAVVALVGTPRKKENHQGSDPTNGIDFLSVKTGAIIGSLTTEDTFSLNDSKNVHWLPGRVLFVRDGGPFARNAQLLFVNAHGARVVEQRPFPALRSLDNFSVSSDGLTWVFGSSSEGWRVYTDFAFKAGKEPFLVSK